MTDHAPQELMAAGHEKAAETAGPDKAREHLIKAHAYRMEVAMARSHEVGQCYFEHRGAADRHRLAMEALIRQRPADFRGELPVLRRVAHA